MDYATALKELRNKKPRDNFMVIEMSYNCKLLLPYIDGLAFMSALTKAEKLQDGYSEQHRIVPVERDTIKSHMMSADEYEVFKLAALLNVTPDEVREFAKAA